ncbi:helix-turn-helix domain-containing protein [Kineosporia succinea]|uniref:Transcriptional regulator with XRE-family HTH domain n=1 Tax=Kineosporia succinea TaxID=84632 RepID=A0ABT9NZW6_9ACTN|nr:helix-turn-helix transcriptional regulator [Kineosporia succinea]MDP9825971.1 transcriptional regulator with XRE-family HTH domain [Kineosporia succinea]
MASRTPPTVRMRRLASELRRLRGAAGMSREDVAGRTDINVATLYRLETAKGRPQRRTLTSLLELYQVAPEERDALFALLKAAGEKGWVQPYAGSIPEEYSMYIQLESEAASVRNYESLLIPGLLQTAGYIRSSSAGQMPLMPADQIDLQAKIRVGRQDLLTRSNPLALWAIVDEAVLHRVVGGPDVMRDQFEHLLSMMELPNVTFQVVPFSAGSHVGMLGSFSLLDFPDPDPTVACVETMAGSMFRETEDEVRACTVAFDHLRATAASPAESARMVTDRLR